MIMTTQTKPALLNIQPIITIPINTPLTQPIQPTSTLIRSHPRHNILPGTQPHMRKLLNRKIRHPRPRTTMNINSLKTRLNRHLKNRTMQRLMHPSIQTTQLIMITTTLPLRSARSMLLTILRMMNTNMHTQPVTIRITPNLNHPKRNIILLQ